MVWLGVPDIRFESSLTLEGWDAMDPNPDHSSACSRLRTDADDDLEDIGFVITVGRGNDVQVAAIRALRPWLVDRPVEELLADIAGRWHELVHDSHLR